MYARLNAPPIQSLQMISTEKRKQIIVTLLEFAGGPEGVETRQHIQNGVGCVVDLVFECMDLHLSAVSILAVLLQRCSTLP